MVARVNTVAFHGIRVMDVDVQVQMAPGLPAFTVVGLPDKAVTESRAPGCAVDYQSKISGPVFDRIDLHVEVPAVNPADLALPPPAEGSAEIAARVAAARNLQKERCAGEEGIPVRTNAEADGALLERVAAPDAGGKTLLAEAAERMRLTARGYHRVLRVARTLADLDGGGVMRIHIAEALTHRRVVPGRQAVLMTDG